ncbi:hypothetical protein Pcinc_012413 [Petrolisthes cinctipes]|uniref:Uncharacterized protein n=1 Tax=Petrolisthes cinctipes TaxID=88211 RepID=A0AAE1G0U6_PETCI|nr:hypothetical protein Pcinc_012413 [Petrolisthes cinctipes]
MGVLTVYEYLGRDRALGTWCVGRVWGARGGIEKSGNSGERKICHGVEEWRHVRQDRQWGAEQEKRSGRRGDRSGSENGSVGGERESKYRQGGGTKGME